MSGLSRRFWLLVSLIVLSISAYEVMGNKSLASQSDSFPATREAISSDTQPIESLYLDEIQRYEIGLTEENLTQEERERLEESLEFARMQATAVAVERPTPDQEQIQGDLLATSSVMTPQPTPTLQTGIIESGDLFVVHPPRRVAIENIWQDVVDDKFIRIYAGLLLPDYRQPDPVQTQHGALYVITLLPTGETVTGLYITEAELGALRITERIGSKLALVDESGETTFFDFLAYQFVDSLETLLPTVTIPVSEATPPAGYP